MDREDAMPIHTPIARRRGALATLGSIPHEPILNAQGIRVRATLS
jgi:hypothetical protein